MYGCSGQQCCVKAVCSFRRLKMNGAVLKMLTGGTLWSPLLAPRIELTYVYLALQRSYLNLFNACSRCLTTRWHNMLKHLVDWFGFDLLCCVIKDISYLNTVFHECLILYRIRTTILDDSTPQEVINSFRNITFIFMGTPMIRGTT